MFVKCKERRCIWSFVLVYVCTLITRAHNRYHGHDLHKSTNYASCPKTWNSWFWPPLQCVRPSRQPFLGGKQKTRNFPQQQQFPRSPAGAKPNILWAKIRRKVRWVLSGENLERYPFEDLDIFSRGIKFILEVVNKLLSNMSSLQQCAVVWQLHEEEREWGLKALKLLRLRSNFTLVEEDLTSRFAWHRDWRVFFTFDLS